MLASVHVSEIKQFWYRSRRIEIFAEELREINGETGYRAYIFSLFKIHLENVMTLKANDDEVRESKTSE